MAEVALESGRFLAAVLFDFGDTLFFSPSGAEVMKEAGVEPGQAARLWDQIWNESKTAGALAVRRDLSPAAHRSGWLALFEPADRLVRGLAEVLYERVMTVERWMPYPDVAEVLDELARRGVPVGVVSNINSDLRPLFRAHDLERLVAAFVLSYEQGLEKPDARLFAIACSELGVEPRQTLVVGDNHIGDGGAVVAGLTLLLLPGVVPGAPRGLDLALRLVANEPAG